MLLRMSSELLDLLIAVDDAVAVEVGLLDREPGPEVDAVHPERAERVLELSSADPAVAVGVDDLQPLLELFHRHLVFVYDVNHGARLASRCSRLFH